MSKTPRTIVARLLVDLRPQLEGYEDLVRFGVGLDGTVLAVGRSSTEVLYDERGGARFPKSRLEQPSSYEVFAWHEHDVPQLRTLEVTSEALSIAYAQPVEEGVLLVGARCIWSPTTVEKNAVVYDWEGREVRRFTLGDGIEDVRTSADGTIWTSYFDEGVFGNRGWNQPGPEPVGAPGLVAFDNLGKVRWSYDAATAGTDSICDVYALNVVAPQDVWIYFYVEFSLVRIVGGSYFVWKLDHRGAHALAVQGQRVLLFGDYQQRDRARVFDLKANGRAQAADELLIVDGEGRGFVDAMPIGAGANLFLIRDRSVFLVEDWWYAA